MLVEVSVDGYVWAHAQLLDRYPPQGKATQVKLRMPHKKLTLVKQSDGLWIDQAAAQERRKGVRMKLRMLKGAS